MADVVWFKRDLRTVDHCPLAAAAARGPVVALYVAEPAYWALPDTAGRQWAFLAESLAELARDLAALGVPLTVRVGDVVSVLADLHARHGIDALHAHEETGNAWTHARDRRVGAWCRSNGVPFLETPQFGVVRGLADRDRWASAWDRRMAEPVTPAPARVEPVSDVAGEPIPDAAALGLAEDPCPLRQRGGRAAALDCLASFLDGRGRTYRRDMSSPLTAESACSRLSAHIAAGTVSMREVAQTANARRRALKAVDPSERPIPLGAIDSLVGRLHWHCHFIQKLESEPDIEWRTFHAFFDDARPRDPDHPWLAAWAAGRTGLPFVDASMRYLAATGWINFRMRAMLMAVASYHLWLDWRDAGAVLARLFVDYEPGIHWPQAQMQSGCTGINTLRIYNPVKQGHDQDADGAFVRRWVPELAGLPGGLVHAPWKLSRESLAAAGVVLGETYPERIVDHEAAAREARRRIGEIRRRPGFREEAQRVYARHGSRKRPNDPVRPRRAEDRGFATADSDAGAGRRTRGAARDRGADGQADLFGGD